MLSSNQKSDTTGQTPPMAAVALLMAKGLIKPAIARRLEILFQGFNRAGVDPAWSVTKLKKNPGLMLARAIQDAPQVMADVKRKDSERVVAISATDLEALVEAAAKAAGPDFATGREMYARLVRSEPPLDATKRGLPRRHQPRMSITEALAARPDTEVASSGDS